MEFKGRPLHICRNAPKAGMYESTGPICPYCGVNMEKKDELVEKVLEQARSTYAEVVTTLLMKVAKFSDVLIPCIGEISIDEANDAIRGYFNEEMDKIVYGERTTDISHN